MQQQLSNRWVQTGVLTVVAVAVGAVVSFLVFAGDTEDTLAGGKLLLATGTTAGGVAFVGKTDGGFGGDSTLLPGTASEALSDGWKEAGNCADGRGRYFQQKGSAETESQLLMYDRDDRLIGTYLYSMAELPAPWQRADELQVNGGAALLDFEHWGIFVYTEDPAGAC